VEDTYLSSADVESVFGATVRRLVEGETKVSSLPRRVSMARSGSSPMTDKEAENLCHLIFAMSEDWRVLVIKLADRLHNMRTIQVRC
jgi:(p)ppGpp synthase/HD superfamily hydrolase